MTADHTAKNSPAKKSAAKSLKKPASKKPASKKTADGTTVKTAVGAGRANQISIDDLLAAKSVSGAVGGSDKVIAAL